MSLRNESYESLKRLTQARIGKRITADDNEDFQYLVNDAVRSLYDRSPYWPRYLRLEPRTVKRGYIADEEDSYHIYGAGTQDSNGLYINANETYEPEFGASYYEAENGYGLIIIPNSLILNGFGSVTNDQVFIISENYLGKPLYSPVDSFGSIYWDGSQWIISSGFGTLYFSTEDVATPDLVTSWQVDQGTAPIGTVSSGNYSQIRNSLSDILSSLYYSSFSVTSDFNWVSGVGEDPTPIAQPLGKIEHIIWQFSGPKWNSTNSQTANYTYGPALLKNYRDSNGIRSTNGPTDGVVWVAYKQQIEDTIGNGTNGTTTEVPYEFYRYVALYVAYQMQRSGRTTEPNPTYTIAYRDVEASADDALLAISREGAEQTIANFHRTYYNYDVSIRP